MAKWLGQIVERVHKFSKLDQDFNFFDKGQLFILLFDQLIKTLILWDYDADFKLIRDKEGLWKDNVSIQLVKPYTCQRIDV